MISFSRSVDINNQPSISLLRNASKDTPLVPLRTLIYAASLISLVACDSSSPPVQNQADRQPESPISTESVRVDLTNDSLEAPQQATLEITSEPGFLNLTWNSIPDQQEAKVYKFDSIEGIEVLVVQSYDSAKQSLKLPSRTHQRAWHNEQFRIELCDATNCISSARVAINEQAEATLQRIRPPVFIEGERFADSVALNSTATLMAVSLPIQGAIDLYLRPADLWVKSQRIALSLNTESSTRRITLALSNSGDTLAALITDEPHTTELKIIERFGEGWFETTSLNLASTTELADNNSHANNSQTLSISEDSDLIIINAGNQVLSTFRNNSGWTALNLLQQEHSASSTSTFSERFSTDAVLKAVSADQAHRRLFTVHSLDQSLWLSVWDQTSENEGSGVWKITSTDTISNVNPAKNVSIHSNSIGDNVILAGWELNTDSQLTPVMWRYQILSPSADNTHNNAALSVVDSIRFPFSTEDSATLLFSADDSLSHVALGWQSTGTTTDISDAAVISYQFSVTANRWLTKLEYPTVFPTLANPSAVHSVLISPNGEAMTISLRAHETNTSQNRAGELLTLQ